MTMNTVPKRSAETDDALIQFSGVGKQYADNAPILVDINLDVHRSELIALVGPSGCGKSTLLNLVAGLTQVSSGSVNVTEPNLRSAYVFQSPRLLPWRSVLSNVEFGLEHIKLDRKERRRRAKAALDLVHLGGHVGKYPHELSGGMQQRAALARGLALEPSLLLLDEPFGALDALTRSYLQEELLSIVRPSDTTTMLVTHDIDEALLLADRIVVLTGRPAEIKKIFDVPFSRDHRDSFDSVLGHPEFVPMRHEIRELLRPDLAADGVAEV